MTRATIKTFLSDEQLKDGYDKTLLAMWYLKAKNLLDAAGLLEPHDLLFDQIKTQKEMYDQSIENDANFSQEDAKAKEAKKIVAGIREKIMKQPAVVEAVARMKELKEEVRDVQDTISALAEQYQEVAHTNQIVKDDGEVLEIIKKYSVRKKRKD
jgi:hypothetical protein